ncbi:hypothetical protein RI845_08825 [Thalassotalea nanhaiensis]|uniref:Uncharacterized protein n=1 Tax=Thalassotalea nanhaiensis TaxID=3065648 RepID=A0ABY9TN95_9GAMM|nr:hypothetical protein RI845_08825 [Colwelliaceae bacterium SQ345]
MNKQFKAFNKTFLATTLAFGLSTLAVAPSFAAEKELHRNIEVIASDDVNAQVTINVNGETSEYTLPREALHDPSKLKSAISDLPEEDQQLILESLGNMPKLHEAHGENVMVIKSGAEDIEWVSEDGEHKRVMVIAMDHNDSDKVIHKVVHKEMPKDKNHVFVKADDLQGSHAKAIKHLISKGKFTAEELNDIQQALDEKR